MKRVDTSTNTATAATTAAALETPVTAAPAPTQALYETHPPLECGAPEGTPLRALQLVELDLMERVDALFKELGLRLGGYVRCGGDLVLGHQS